MADKMASFSLNTGMTFMDSRSSAVAVSASLNPVSRALIACEHHIILGRYWKRPTQPYWKDKASWS